MSSTAGAPSKTSTIALQQNASVQRQLRDIKVPPGALKMSITHPSENTNGFVFVTSIQNNSPVFGRIRAGDWILSINGFAVTSRDKCVELFSSTVSFTRTICISRAAAVKPTVFKDKENSQNTVASVAPTKPPSPLNTLNKPLSDRTTSLGMTAKQLKEVMAQQHVSDKGTKDDMLQRVGIPAKQWKQWQSMKLLQLKPILEQHGLVAKGTKHEMLTRLGVPIGFGERERQHKERMKENKKRKVEAFSKTMIEALTKKIKASDEDDPNHEEYCKPCCKSPQFNSRGEPAGCIDFSDGSVMEVWMCETCGKVPEYPNAPHIHYFL